MAANMSTEELLRALLGLNGAGKVVDLGQSSKSAEKLQVDFKELLEALAPPEPEPVDLALLRQYIEAREAPKEAKAAEAAKAAKAAKVAELLKAAEAAEAAKAAKAAETAKAAKAAELLKVANATKAQELMEELKRRKAEEALPDSETLVSESVWEKKHVELRKQQWDLMRPILIANSDKEPEEVLELMKKATKDHVVKEARLNGNTIKHAGVPVANHLKGQGCSHASGTTVACLATLLDIAKGK